MLANRLATVARRFCSNKYNALQFLPQNEKEAYLKRIEENALFDYKVYPSLPHQDPQSP